MLRRIRIEPLGWLLIVAIIAAILLFVFHHTSRDHAETVTPAATPASSPTTAPPPATPPLQPTAAPATSPTPQAVVSPQPHAHQHAKSSPRCQAIATVHFAIDSSELLPEEIAGLQQSFKPLDASVRKVEVVGYCDNIGEEKWNFILSRRRAEAVAKLAAAAFPDTPLATEGMGSEHPVASNAKGKGRALNRRAVVLVCGR